DGGVPEKPFWMRLLLAATKLPALTMSGPVVPEALLATMVLSNCVSVAPLSPWNPPPETAALVLTIVLLSTSKLAPGCRSKIPARAPAVVLLAIVELTTRTDPPALLMRRPPPLSPTASPAWLPARVDESSTIVALLALPSRRMPPPPWLGALF